MEKVKIPKDVDLLFQADDPQQPNDQKWGYDKVPEENLKLYLMSPPRHAYCYYFDVYFSKLLSLCTDIHTRTLFSS